jgi:cell division protein YceG involved in septum cleavage
VLLLVVVVVIVLVMVEVLVVLVMVMVYSAAAQYRVLASCHSGFQTCNVPQGDGVSHLPNFIH